MSLLKEYAKVLNEFALNRSCPTRLEHPAGRYLQLCHGISQGYSPSKSVFHPWLKMVAFGI